MDVKGDIEACLAPNGGEKMRAQHAVRGGGREKRERQEGERGIRMEVQGSGRCGAGGALLQIYCGVLHWIAG